MAPRRAASAKPATIAKVTKPAPAPKKAAAKPAANGASRKRKAEVVDDAEAMDIDKPEIEKRPIKKAKATVAAPAKRARSASAAPPARRAKSASVGPPSSRQRTTIGKVLNQVPTEILDVYVFGEGSSGELGLGSKVLNGKKPIDVKRPRLNENLSQKTVGVVQLASGGMHAIALTRDNHLLTWGVNDQGALGRDTTWDGGLVDMDKAEGSDSEDDEDDVGLNPHESVPGRVEDSHFVPGTKFVQVVASDSASFVLTEDGRVYGWGTFRSSDGILGFSETIKIQPTPMLMPTLKNVKSLAAGSNHILALDHAGHVVAWGCGQQNQLGRRIIERNKMSSLTPQGLGLRSKVEKIACGSYHSFAIDRNGGVWGWGLNNFGELGIEADAGDDNAAILKPAKISYLEDFNITDVQGGEHHSLACSSDGQLLTWGRVDGSQTGIDPASMTKDNAIFDDRNTARILFVPTTVPNISGIVSVAAGTDNSFAITKDGQVYSWGFSANYQTGQGKDDDVERPTLIDNTAIRGKKIVAAGAGGQFSILLGKADAQINGVNGH